MTIPTIQSIGLPPERHAARVVAEMCKWLDGENMRMIKNIRENVLPNSKVRSTLGNEVAQRRFAERMHKHTGKAILYSHLEPGKRGAFEFNIVNWHVRNPESEKPWLVCMLTTIWGKPRNVESRECFQMTHHAMQRLAERAGLRTPDALLDAMRMLWAGMAKALASDPLEVHVPIGENLVAVCERAKAGEKFTVKTVKPFSPNSLKALPIVFSDQSSGSPPDDCRPRSFRSSPQEATGATHPLQ